MMGRQVAHGYTRTHNGRLLTVSFIQVKLRSLHTEDNVNKRQKKIVPKGPLLGLPETMQRYGHFLEIQIKSPP